MSFQIPQNFPQNKSSSGKVAHLQTDVEIEELLRSTDRMVVLDIFADWCGPCNFIAPKFEELSTTFTNIVFAKIKIENLGKYTTVFSVSALPTFIFVREGKMVDKHLGANIKELTQKLASFNFI
jgi:thioredoxin 1